MLLSEYQELVKSDPDTAAWLTVIPGALAPGCLRREPFKYKKTDEMLFMPAVQTKLWSDK